MCNGDDDAPGPPVSTNMTGRSAPVLHVVANVAAMLES